MSSSTTPASSVWVVRPRGAARPWHAALQEAQGRGVLPGQQLESCLSVLSDGPCMRGTSLSVCLAAESARPSHAYVDTRLHASLDTMRSPDGCVARPQLAGR